MNVMVVGGGGREHAIIKKLLENPTVEKIFALPGNGGIAGEATCVDIKATDIEGIAAFAKANPIDFAVVASDDPLVLGAVDRLHALGLPCFGPDSRAALIEGSKVFSKDLMKRYGIPTAEYAMFTDADAALDYIETCPIPTVIKPDGLTLGKGVMICHTRDQARGAVRSIMRDGQFGSSGDSIVVEEFLSGPEVSVLAFTDGIAMVPMVSSMDHKRALDGDEGVNTGGMGTVAPNPCYTPEMAQRCMREIFLPTMRAMNAEGRTFKGCLYIGLMLTEDGPKVIEYNCRFGDPEAQVVLPLLRTDLLTVFQAVENQTLSDLKVEFSSGAACCVMVVSGGYPAQYKKGCGVSLGCAADMPGVQLYHSGTALRGNELVTAGGRVIGVSATAETLEAARERAYAAAKEIRFDGAYYRSDIGKLALEIQGRND